MLLVSAGVCAGENSAGSDALRSVFSRSPYAGSIRRCWADCYTSNDSGKKLRSGVPYYPTEPGIVLLSAWIATGEAKYREAAVLQFEFAHSRENDDALLITEQGFNRDTQARQIYNFYAAYRILGDRKYLMWADKGAQALIKHLPRSPHQVLGTQETYTLFAAGYCKPDKPYDTSVLKPWVDVNQNAELALAYTLLYFEPASVLHKSPVAKDIAINEMEAGLAIQEGKTGAIPIGDSDYWITRYDTMYGSYGLFSWAWLNTLWKNPDWQKHIDSAGRWLRGFSAGEGEWAHRYHPSESKSLEPVDLWCRVPAFWKIGYKPHRMIGHVYLSKEPPAEKWSYAPFAYFELMKIPPAFYLMP